jgi:hypothetical protein
MSRYDNYAYFLPLRPGEKEKIPPSAIVTYEKDLKFVGQIKKNGTNNMAFIHPERTVKWMTRHAEPHKAWLGGNDKSSAIFRAWPGRGWAVVNMELLHSKVPLAMGGCRDTNFIFDLYVHDSEKLTGMTFEERYALLFSLLKDKITGEAFGHYILNEKTWLAKNFSKGLTKLYHSLKDPIDEGVVLKNPKAKMGQSGQQDKCRRPKTAISW